MSPSRSEAGPLDQLAEEFLARCRRGERPAVSEYAAQHPELAEQIRDLFPALLVMEDLGSVGGELTGPFAPQSADEGAVPRQLGEYRILRQVGRGGMGVVYEAVQESLGRHVALKVLPFHAALTGTHLERFRREAKAAARLHHSNIVPVYEVGRDGEVAYFAMQFIEGHGLDKVIDELARLRDPGRKPVVAQGLGPTVAAAAPGAGEPALGRIAESLLKGRFATEGAVPSTGVRPAAVTGPAETEPLARDAAP